MRSHSEVLYITCKDLNVLAVIVPESFSKLFNILLRTLCLILLTAFLICKATDVASFLLTKEKLVVACGDTGNGNNTNKQDHTGNCDDTGTCDNEKTEIEKAADDQLLISHSMHFDKFCLAIPLKSSFSYTLNSSSEIYRHILSPPPELV